MDGNCANRQSHLGPSPNNTLCIVDPEVLVIPGQAQKFGDDNRGTTNAQRTEMSGHSYIFRLPDELLLSIVELASFGRLAVYSGNGCPECDFAPNTKTVKSLMRVCRHIYQIAQPLLFYTVRLAHRNQVVPPTKSTIRLHHVLGQNPSLRQHVKVLTIHITDIRAAEGPVDFKIANDLVQWLTRVRCLTFHGGFEGAINNPRTWSLIRSANLHMKEVTHCDLSREGWGLYLGPVMKEIGWPRLKRLQLHGISEDRKGISGQVCKQILRAASIASMSISDYEESPQSTKLLIHWPAALVHFEFASFYNNRFTMDYPMFQTWLFVHRETLRTIDIGYLSGAGSKRLFDATYFPSLERLKLSRWQMSSPLHFIPEDANVLGPKVKLFQWDFGIYDQHSESWNDFGAEEEAWIRDLGKAAVARKSALGTIKIEFNPEDDGRWSGVEPTGYPWDRMDRVRDEVMRPNGMDLVYSAPLMTKEEWIVDYAEWKQTDLEQSNQSQSIAGSGESTVSEAEAEWDPRAHGRDIREYFRPTQKQY